MLQNITRTHIPAEPPLRELLLFVTPLCHVDALFFSQYAYVRSGIHLLPVSDFIFHIISQDVCQCLACKFLSSELKCQSKGNSEIYSLFSSLRFFNHQLFTSCICILQKSSHRAIIRPYPHVVSVQEGSKQFIARLSTTNLLSSPTNIAV